MQKSTLWQAQAPSEGASEVSQSCLTLCESMDSSLQGLNLGLPHYRQTLYCLSYQAGC